MDDRSDFLCVQDLRVVPKSGRVVLDVPLLKLSKGRALGVRGASGAGKSTLLAALMGLLPRAEGQVLWDRADLLKLSQRKRRLFRRTRVGTIFQDFLLFDELSAIDNAAILGLFRPKADRQPLSDQAAALVTDLNVPIEARTMASFSGGERQRVAVARALAHEPDIILADEPTAALPSDAGEALITDLLTRVRDGDATLITVSHDDAVLSRMDEVITLHHGQLVEHDSHD